MDDDKFDFHLKRKRKINIEDIKDWIFGTWLCSIVLVIFLFFMWGGAHFVIWSNSKLGPRPVEKVNQLIELLSPEQKERYNKWLKQR